MDTASAGDDAAAMTVLEMPAAGAWLADARTGGDRALRVSWHLELGCVVLSTWRDGACVGTVRLTAAEAARLVGALTDGLAAGFSAEPPDTLQAATREERP